MDIHIYYPRNGHNYGMKAETFMYTRVCTINIPADTKDPYEWAIKKTQDVEDSDFHLLGIRPSCVGDIMQTERDYELNKCFMIT